MAGIFCFYELFYYSPSTTRVMVPSGDDQGEPQRPDSLQSR